MKTVILSALLFLCCAGAIADDRKTDIKLWQSVCDNGEDKQVAAINCYRLAVVYRDGMGVKKDHNKSAEYYNKSCKLNGLDSCVWLDANDWELGLAAYINFDSERALSYWQKACENQDPRACRELGSWHKHGDRGGINKNIARANEYYKKALLYLSKLCDRNNAESCTTLGYMYYVGEGLTEDYKTAYKYYAKACAMGDRDACETRDDFAEDKANMQ